MGTRREQPEGAASWVEVQPEEVEVKHHRMMQEDMLVMRVYAHPGVSRYISEGTKGGLGEGEGSLGKWRDICVGRRDSVPFSPR